MRGPAQAAQARARSAGLVAGSAASLAALVAGVLGVLAMLAPSANGTTAAALADQQTAEWTMMVYAVADTENIGSLMTEDLAELTALPDDPDVNVVVLVDMPHQGEPGGGDGDLPGIGPFTDSKLLKVEGGKFEEVRDLGELSMARPDTRAAFIAEAADTFPARHYGLTLMDHGGAYTGGYLDHTPTSEQMSVADIRNGMIMGMQQAGIDKFDVVFHSSCLMSNYEAASALAPLADVIAGSEEVMYVFAMLQAAGFATAQSGGDGEAIGEAFIDAYADRLESEAQAEPQYADQLGQLRDLVALSVVKGDKMEALDQALQAFSNAAVAHMDEIVNEVARARAQTLQFMVSQPGVDATGYDLFDLGDFLSHLQDVPDDVAVARDAAYAALTSAVTHQVTGRGTAQAKGLSVYLPITDEWVPDYLSAGDMPPGWAAFVKSFVAAAGASSNGQDQPGGATFASPDAQVLQADTSGIKIAGQLVSGGADQVVDSETQVYTPIGGQQNALAIVLPAYVNAGGEGQVQGTWDYSLTALSDGKDVVPATTIYQAQQGGLIGTFLAQYVSPAGDTSDIGVRLLLSQQGDIESVSTFSINQDGTSTAGVPMEVGGRLTPYVFVDSSGGFSQELSNQTIAVSDQLSVTFERLPKGTGFDMGVLVGDAAGNYDGAFTTQEVL